MQRYVRVSKRLLAQYFFSIGLSLDQARHKSNPKLIGRNSCLGGIGAWRHHSNDLRCWCYKKRACGTAVLRPRSLVMWIISSPINTVACLMWVTTGTCARFIITITTKPVSTSSNNRTAPGKSGHHHPTTNKQPHKPNTSPHLLLDNQTRRGKTATQGSYGSMIAGSVTVGSGLAVVDAVLSKSSRVHAPTNTRSVSARGNGTLAGMGDKSAVSGDPAATTNVPFVEPTSVTRHVLVAVSWVSSACLREMP